MNYQIGQKLYYGCVQDGKTELWEYIITAKRAGKLHCIHKCSATWVKKSKKHFDYGWSSSIPSYFRDSVNVGEVFVGKETTPLKAWYAAKKYLLARRERFREREKINKHTDIYKEIEEEFEIDLKAIKRRIAMHKRKTKKV